MYITQSQSSNTVTTNTQKKKQQSPLQAPYQLHPATLMTVISGSFDVTETNISREQHLTPATTHHTSNNTSHQQQHIIPATTHHTSNNTPHQQQHTTPATTHYTSNNTSHQQQHITQATTHHTSNNTSPQQQHITSATTHHTSNTQHPPYLVGKRLSSSTERCTNDSARSMYWAGAHLTFLPFSSTHVYVDEGPL